MNRDVRIDYVRGVLIMSVVAAHFQEGMVHDIIFLFHMPLFFVLSGYLLEYEKITDTTYLKQKMMKLLIPYICYMSLDFFLVRRTFSVKDMFKLVWGGRAIAGTYWYMTCFLVALCVFCVLLRNFDEKNVRRLILLGGGIAIIESHMSEHIRVLKYPGIPWSADTALLALVYLAIGFYQKRSIKTWMSSHERKFDAAAMGAAAIGIVFCLVNYCGESKLYYFDMKPLYYRELLLAIAVPCVFGVILLRFVYWFDRYVTVKWIKNLLCVPGQATIPIMFLHVPLNEWKEILGYGPGIYCLIGLGIPVLFSFLCNRFGVMRTLFGLTAISGER